MRLIDADEYKKSIIEAVNDQFRKGNMTGAFWLTYLDSLLDAQPTIDAVPVIRCEDCKYHIHGVYSGSICYLSDLHVKNEDYCSKAKEGEYNETD